MTTNPGADLARTWVNIASTASAEQPVQITRLGLGAAPLGNLFHEVTEDAAQAVLSTALEAGLGYFDVAPHYGMGLAEERIGRALARWDGRRPTISTKVGRLIQDNPDGSAELTMDEGYLVDTRRKRVWDLSADGIKRSIDASLQRLGTDRIEIVFLHDSDEAPNGEQQAYDSAFPTLVELRDQGLIGAIGAGTNTTELPTAYMRDFDLDVMLCAGRYSLLDRAAEAEMLPMAVDRGVSIVIGGVYNSGLLADPHQRARFNYEPADQRLVDTAVTMEEVCTSFGVPLRAAALQFPYRNPAITSVLVGWDDAGQVTDALDQLQVEIPEDCWAQLEQVREQHPVPDRS